MKWQQALKLCGLIMGLMFHTHGAAQSEQSAYDVVVATTDSVMQVLKAADQAEQSDPDQYYADLKQVMDQVVDYRGFARGVMGPFAGRSYYQSLSEEGQQRLRQQLEEFTAVMRDNLVETYAKGLIAFAEATIEVVEPEQASEGRAVIEQRISRDNDQPYRVLYQMGQSRGGQWQLRNVIIEDVNLGEIYRSQFESAAKRAAKAVGCGDGDTACLESVIDTVISTWGAEQ